MTTAEETRKKPGQKKTVASIMGVDKLQAFAEELREQRKKLKEADLPDNTKDDIDRELAKAIGRLSSGTVAQQLMAMNRMQSGEDDSLNTALHKLMASKVEEALLGGKPSAQSTAMDQAFGTFLSRLVDAVPMGQNGKDPVRSALDEAVATVVKEKFSGGEPRAEDSIQQAIMSKALAKLTDALDQEPMHPIDQLNAAVETVQSFSQLMERMGAGRSEPAGPAVNLDLEKMRLDLEMKKIDQEEKVARYRIDKEYEAEVARAAAFREVAELAKNAVESIGSSVAAALMQGEVDEWDDAPRAQRQAPVRSAPPGMQAVECPECHEPSVMIGPKLAARIQAGEFIPVSCSSCGAQHHFGSGNQEPPAASRSPEWSDRQAEEEAAPDMADIMFARGG